MSSSCPATLENGGHNDGVEMAIGQAGEGRRSTDNIGPPVTGTCRRATSLLKSSSCSATSKNGGQDRVEMAKQVGRRSAENVDPPATGSRPHGGSGLFQRSNDDNGTLLVVATLITTLSYQVGSNVPGGYWQDDAPGHHVAGEPIMRTQRRFQYHVFIWSSWFGFGASMGLTLALLTGVPPRSRFVRGALHRLLFDPHPQLRHPAGLLHHLGQPPRMGRCHRPHYFRRQQPHPWPPPKVLRLVM